jgi:hypothetical protein
MCLKDFQAKPLMMNEIKKTELRSIGEKEYRCPVFKYNEEDILSLILIYSGTNVRSLFLDKIESINIAIDKGTVNEEFEVIQDELSEIEKDLPVQLREDTGFNLGKIIYLQSYVHELYLYFRLESDQVAVFQYKPNVEYQLRLFDRKYFVSLCEQWLRELEKG